MVSLSFSDILGQRFDPVVDALMPPGANELTGNRSVVEKIDVHGRDDPDGYTCTVHFSDKTTNIEVIVFRDKIIVREDLPGIADRLACWYDYKCLCPTEI